MAVTCEKLNRDDILAPNEYFYKASDDAADFWQGW